MFAVLKHTAYRRLFTAQVVALVGTGLSTFALALLAYELAGDKAGAVLGTAFAIKMVAYVGVASLAGACADRLPRRQLLVAMDLLRAGVALTLPFVDAIWQIYLLIFILQSASAVFTPVFQATVPDILSDERDYTNALSLSRLAYDLESLLSPVLAGLLLSFVSFHWLFAGTSVGFVFSALLVAGTVIPVVVSRSAGLSFGKRLTLGGLVFLHTPRLRGVMAVNFAAAFATAMVLVNTVVYVREVFGRPENELAVALGAFGCGSMILAFLLPRLLERVEERRIMLLASAVQIIALAVLAVSSAQLADVAGGWWIFLVLYLVMGGCFAAMTTPIGRVLKRSVSEADRPALFATQFALSHACWLLAYPLAGQGGVFWGLATTAMVLVGLAALSLLSAVLVWPEMDEDALLHEHSDLPEGHPHLEHGDVIAVAGGGFRHRHSFVIDDLHERWPHL